MVENSKIEWTDHTFNPWLGCTKISPACDHCYAESWAKRTGNAELWQGERRRTSAASWKLPLKWAREAERSGVRRKVFCASLADVFDNQVPDEWRRDLFDMIRATPQLDWLLLTKRPQNIAKMLPEDWGTGWLNVWLGTTVANQEEADQNIPHLLNTSAAKRFLSCEPLLGPIDLTPEADYIHQLLSEWYGPDGFDETGSQPRQLRRQGYFPRVDWVICGGESGSNARPMHPNWARSLRDQCQVADVPFFFKQWGEWVHWMSLAGDSARPVGQGVWLSDACMLKVGKRSAVALLDGREWREMPT